MSTLNKAISYASLGLASLLSSCDENKDVNIARGKINDAGEVRIIKNIKWTANDTYTLEIYNAAGNIRGRLEFLRLPSGYIQYEDKIVNFRDGEVLTEDNFPYKAEK